MLKISLKRKVSNEEIGRSQVADVVVEYKKWKMRWASHVARFNGNQWAQEQQSGI